MTGNEIIKALEDLLKNFDGKVIDFMAISSAVVDESDIDNLVKETVGDT